MAISASIDFVAFVMQIIREFIHSNYAHSRKDANGKNRDLIFLVKSSQMNEGEVPTNTRAKTEKRTRKFELFRRLFYSTRISPSTR
jgi:hypothetical protein